MVFYFGKYDVTGHVIFEYIYAVWITPDTGNVVFEDVYEDQYSLYAEADDHSSYGAVILITSDTTEQDIFLQRVAVKYTWTVEPTAVEDVYNIQLESTFETYVSLTFYNFVLYNPCTDLMLWLVPVKFSFEYHRQK